MQISRDLVSGLVQVAEVVKALVGHDAAGFVRVDGTGGEGGEEREKGRS